MKNGARSNKGPLTNQDKKPGLPKTGGRNNQGRITTRHIGGGFKRAYRAVEYRKEEYTTVMSAVITRVEYDPNRTAYLAECVSKDKTFSS